jgi:hypothetical protein
MTLFAEFHGMAGIMDPTVRSDETGNYLLFGINGYRRFEKVFAEFPGSF